MIRPWFISLTPNDPDKQVISRGCYGFLPENLKISRGQEMLCGSNEALCSVPPTVWYLQAELLEIQAEEANLLLPPSYTFFYSSFISCCDTFLFLRHRSQATCCGCHLSSKSHPCWTQTRKEMLDGKLKCNMERYLKSLVFWALVKLILFGFTKSPC